MDFVRKVFRRAKFFTLSRVAQRCSSGNFGRNDGQVTGRGIKIPATRSLPAKVKGGVKRKHCPGEGDIKLMGNTVAPLARSK